MTYYMRFMWHGLRMLWPGFPLALAIRTIHNEYINLPVGFDRSDPKSDVHECLSYWGDGV